MWQMYVCMYVCMYTNVSTGFRVPEFQQTTLAPTDQQGGEGGGEDTQGGDGGALGVGAVH